MNLIGTKNVSGSEVGWSLSGYGADIDKKPDLTLIQKFYVETDSTTPVEVYVQAPGGELLLRGEIQHGGDDLTKVSALVRVPGCTKITFKGGSGKVWVYA